jgi:ribonuclease R
MGSDTGLTIGIGQRVTVKLPEALPVPGGIALELISLDGKDMPRGPTGFRARGKPGKRKLIKAKRKSAKVKRKVERKRRG